MVKSFGRSDVPQAVGIEVVESTLPNGLKRNLEKSNIPFGRSASPLIYEDKVIVSGGGSQNRYAGVADPRLTSRPGMKSGVAVRKVSAIHRRRSFKSTVATKS